MTAPGLAVLAVLLAGSFGPYPPGTLTFSNTDAVAAMTAPDGGAWVGTSRGTIVQYSEAGPVRVLNAPCCSEVRHLAMAPDGTIWFANLGMVGRISITGTVLEQYSASVNDLAVASDGALWFTASSGGIGRIANGAVTTFPDPVFAWAAAPASGGEVWVIDSGFSSGELFRVHPSGSITATPLPYDTLLSELQTISDGSLYVGTLGAQGVLRRSPAGEFTLIPDVSSRHFVVDQAGNLWSGGGAALTYVDASGSTRVSGELPSPAWCAVPTAFGYAPIAIDTAGGVWVRRLPPPPPPQGGPVCTDPFPALPDLLRIDPAQFLAANHVPEHIPSLSPVMLAALGLALTFLGAWHARR